MFRENPMPGEISLSFEHEPNYFADADLPEQTKQTIVAREEGRVVCAGYCSIRQRFVNGTPRRVGYLGGLRLCSGQAGRFDILRRGYEFFRTLQSDSPADFYFTSIASDNHPARRFLERGLPGMPAYEFIGEFVTLLLPARHRPATSNRAAALTPAAEELITLFNEYGCRQQFAPCWSNAELTALKPLGLRESDFCFVRQRGQIVACAALWDQRVFKQTVIRGYTLRLALLRPALNLTARITGGTRLPAVGQTLANVFVSHLSVAPDESDALIALTAELRSLAAQRQIELLTFGFAANDPRLATLRRSFRVREYHTRLYVVRWPGTGGTAGDLDARILAPETALL
ncbi:MAG: hypothetical protein ACLQU4_14885 [Limisphaerales bacterium]